MLSNHLKHKENAHGTATQCAALVSQAQNVQGQPVHACKHACAHMRRVAGAAGVGGGGGGGLKRVAQQRDQAPRAATHMFLTSV